MFFMCCVLKNLHVFIMLFVVLKKLTCNFFISCVPKIAYNPFLLWFTIIWCVAKKYIAFSLLVS